MSKNTKLAINNSSSSRWLWNDGNTTAPQLKSTNKSIVRFYSYFNFGLITTMMPLVVEVHTWSIRPLCHVQFVQLYCHRLCHSLSTTSCVNILFHLLLTSAQLWPSPQDFPTDFIFLWQMLCFSTWSLKKFSAISGFLENIVCFKEQCASTQKTFSWMQTNKLFQTFPYVPRKSFFPCMMVLRKKHFWEMCQTKLCQGLVSAVLHVFLVESFYSIHTSSIKAKGCCYDHSYTALMLLT